MGKQSNKYRKANNPQDFIRQLKTRTDHLILDLGYKKLGAATGELDTLIDQLFQLLAETGISPRKCCLDLSYNNLGDAGAYILAKAINQGIWKFFSHIILDSNNISSEGCQLLWEAVAKMASTTPFRLSLARNHIGYEGMRSLYSLLEKGLKIPTLYLNLSANCLNDNDIAIFKDFYHKPDLQGFHLNLSNNAISEAAINNLLNTLNKVGAQLTVKSDRLNDVNLISNLENNKMRSRAQKYSKKATAFFLGAQDKESIGSHLPGELMGIIATLLFLKLTQKSRDNLSSRQIIELICTENPSQLSTDKNTFLR